MVMDMCGSVQGKPDEKVIFPEEASPCTVQENAIGLQPVAENFSFPVTPFQVNGLGEKGQTHQGRLAALPPDGNLFLWLAHELFDQFFQHRFAHTASFRSGMTCVPIPVETISAGHIAIGARWFDQNTMEGFSIHVLMQE